MKSLQVVLPTRRPAFIWGGPGVGKSSVVRAAADALNLSLGRLPGAQLSAALVRVLVWVVDRTTGKLTLVPVEVREYRLSQRCRKKVEECFGWLKSVAGLGRSRVVGRWKLRQVLEVSAAAFNLVRMRRLAPVVG
jgi:hypothetical protein